MASEDAKPIFSLVVPNEAFCDGGELEDPVDGLTHGSSINPERVTIVEGCVLLESDILFIFNFIIKKNKSIFFFSSKNVVKT